LNKFLQSNTLPLYVYSFRDLSNLEEFNENVLRFVELIEDKHCFAAWMCEWVFEGYSIIRNLIYSNVELIGNKHCFAVWMCEWVLRVIQLLGI